MRVYVCYIANYIIDLLLYAKLDKNKIVDKFNFCGIFVFRRTENINLHLFAILFCINKYNILLLIISYVLLHVYVEIEK